MDTWSQIDKFLKCSEFAVAGASTNREKYGNKVLRCYQQNNRKVYPVNNRADEIEGLKCYPSILDLPEGNFGLSIITPPKITESVVQDAAKKGIKHVWMQPGAESVESIKFCEENNINIIADGSCLLVVLGYREI